MHFDKPAPRPNAIRQAVEMILEAERPVLMPGGGVIIADASEELVELAEYLQTPVSSTYMGKGAIPEDHPLYMGIVSLQTQQRYANALFLESDWWWGSATAGPSGTPGIWRYIAATAGSST